MLAPAPSPDWGLNSHLLQQKSGVLTPEPPGKSPARHLCQLLQTTVGGGNRSPYSARSVVIKTRTKFGVLPTVTSLTLRLITLHSQP